MAIPHRRRPYDLQVVGRMPRRGRPHGIAIKRVYDAPESTDGYRVLIDRLWPRGVSKQRAALDAWLTELAPSTALRTRFHHDVKRWPEFARRYRAELRAHSAAADAATAGTTAARDAALWGT